MGPVQPAENVAVDLVVSWVSTVQPPDRGLPVIQCSRVPGNMLAALWLCVWPHTISHPQLGGVLNQRFSPDSSSSSLAPSLVELRQLDSGFESYKVTVLAIKATHLTLSSREAQLNFVIVSEWAPRGYHFP